VGAARLQLELGEDPAACVAREISEETGWAVTAGPILDAWQHRIRPAAVVLIVTYGCYKASAAEPVISAEHRQAGLFTPAEADRLRMPGGYQRSIRARAARPAAREARDPAWERDATASP
jgi:ADP-ribose pyrophosphatase YjhB (NUDIX family)